MALHKILRYPDARLKIISEPVINFDQQLRVLLADLVETMDAAPYGVGIAAPQIGFQQRIIIVDCTKTRRPVPNHGRLILVNPELITWDGMALGREGCMSIPDYTGNVIRAVHIELHALNESGEKNSYQFENFEARAVQHELDHLEGILFIDRLVSRRTDLFQRKS